MNGKIKYVSVLMMFMVSLKVTGQVVPKETIVDEVYRNFIDSTFTSYYVLETCEKFKLSSDDWNNIRTRLRYVVPANSLDEIIAKSQVDTLPLKWTQPALANVIKCASPVEASNIIGRQFSDTSKLTKKEIEDQKKTWTALPRFKKTVYIFSRPIFDKKGQFAFIKMGSQEGIITPSGGWSVEYRSCIFLLKSIKGHWRLIQKINCTS
jgi:hypothetical protein